MCILKEKPASNQLDTGFSAVPRGLEPPTPSLGNWCSIHLNYGTIYLILNYYLRIMNVLLRIIKILSVKLHCFFILTFNFQLSN